MDEFEDKQKELEGVINPIMAKIYQVSGCRRRLLSGSLCAPVLQRLRNNCDVRTAGALKDKALT